MTARFLRVRGLTMLIMPIILIFLASIAGCEGSQKVLSRSKGGSESMNAHRMGRFSINVPTTMDLKVYSSKLRNITMQELSWPSKVSHEVAREKVWKARLAEIADTAPPRKLHIIEVRDLSLAGIWAKGVLYREDNEDSEEDISDAGAKWDLLVDTGQMGIWLKTETIIAEALNIEKAIRNLAIIAKAYSWQPPLTAAMSQGGNCFYLRNGAIDLPYRWQEQTHARFEGHPLDLKLEIEMQDTHHVVQAGLMERLGNALVSRYVLGVDVDRIRSRKRTVAGLKGEDVIIRMKDKYKTMLSFAWEYAGEENSGERPEIQITMESPDGALEEKIKVWDLILDSFKPMYSHKN